MSVLDTVLALVLQTLRIAVPYLFAAAGGVLAERAGVISLTLEGFMLGGAFGAVVGEFYLGGAWIGVGVGIAFGLALAAIHLLIVGVTRFFLRLAFGSSSNSPRIAAFGETGGLLGSLASPLLWLGLVTIPVAAWLLYRTPFGLRVRAAGEHPDAAASVGVSVPRVRYAAVLISGALASLGGVYLAFEQHQFSDQMTAGRGFIAVAAVIFGRWNPLLAGGACLLFAAAETLEIQLQATTAVPSQFIGMIPYILTIVALAGVVGRSVAPAALGKIPD